MARRSPRIARSWLPPRARVLLFVLAGVHLGSIWLGAAGSQLPHKVLPGPFRFFTQAACLFPHAGEYHIEYRAEGWVCDERKFEPVDVRPFFPIHAENKESRFHRALRFYRRERKAMRALDAYIVDRLDQREPGRYGGVRFMSLRIPLPEPGDEIGRFEYRPLADYPDDMRKHWYWTPASMRRERCRP